MNWNTANTELTGFKIMPESVFRAVDKTAVLRLTRPLATTLKMQELYPMLEYEIAAGKTYQLYLVWGIFDNESSEDQN